MRDCLPRNYSYDYADIYQRMVNNYISVPVLDYIIPFALLIALKKHKIYIHIFNNRVIDRIDSVYNVIPKKILCILKQINFFNSIQLFTQARKINMRLKPGTHFAHGRRFV